MSEFPQVTGSNLEGRRFQLPQDFEGKLNLAIVAFQRWHQDLVDTWVPLARRLRSAYPDFRYYELPTIWRMNPLFRWSIDAGMRAGIADRGAREATITLYLDKEPFRQVLEIPDEATIHLFLVERSGRVLWRTDGPFTEEAGEALARAVQQHLAGD
jgi:hypothetical protein